MRIVADENIPFVSDAFGVYGDVREISGRDITSDIVKDCDLLLVRSVTKVNSELLDGSSVKFVGTTTIGIDHIDVEYLKQRSIGFAHAPGSNAVSVSEYVLSAIYNFFSTDEISSGKCIGIVGVGNVGKEVYRRAEALGFDIIANDPPKKELTGSGIFASMDELLEKADIVTIHVPLVRDGKYPTDKFLGEEFFSRIKKGTMFINASRGDVVDEEALLKNRDRLGRIVLDVWNGEPSPDNRIVELTDIATPHIAGYSFDGKINGVKMIRDAFDAFNFKTDRWDTSVAFPNDDTHVLNLKKSRDTVRDAVLTAYDCKEDDERMRKILAIKDISERSSYFDSLRKGYPRRLEFSHYRTEVVSSEYMQIIKKIGFSD